MKKLEDIFMKNLSFPDFEVEKMEFFPEKKLLKVFVEGACLEKRTCSTKLGKGILFFIDWESITINRLDPNIEEWSSLEENPEELKDLCEVKFSHSEVILSGVGKLKGQWLEWKIIKPRMYAYFE